jgi:hypothetical protein
MDTASSAAEVTQQFCSQGSAASPEPTEVDSRVPTLGHPLLRDGQLSRQECIHSTVGLELVLVELWGNHNRVESGLLEEIRVVRGEFSCARLDGLTKPEQSFKGAHRELHMDVLVVVNQFMLLRTEAEFLDHSNRHRLVDATQRRLGTATAKAEAPAGWARASA